MSPAHLWRHSPSENGRSAAEPVVRFGSVTKRFGDVTAIEDVTFDVEPGRILGLLGRNGAGKTTALRVALGLAAPTSGTVTIFGQRYADLPEAKRRVGVTMDCLGHPPGASGRRELTIWATMLGIPRARVDELLRLVDLPVDDRREVTKYSTGMQQRLALAVALMSDPEVLILDEPANGLDPVGVRWLRDLLRGLAAEGRTIVLSSHQLAEVEQTVDDVVILQQQVRYAGTIYDLTAARRHRLEDRFLELVGAPTEAPAHA